MRCVIYYNFLTDDTLTWRYMQGGAEGRALFIDTVLSTKLATIAERFHMNPEEVLVMTYPHIYHIYTIVMIKLDTGLMFCGIVCGIWNIYVVFNDVFIKEKLCFIHDTS